MLPIKKRYSKYSFRSLILGKFIEIKMLFSKLGLLFISGRVIRENRENRQIRENKETRKYMYLQYLNYACGAINR